jgi:hypothetical protein
VLEVLRDFVDRRKNGIPARHGQCPAGAEVVLHVDDEEDVVGGSVHQRISSY